MSPLVIFITLGHVREMMEQLFIISVDESTEMSVQFRRMKSPVSEVIAHEVICNSD